MSKAEGQPTGVPPSVLVVMGVSGSGKTTIAKLLAERLGWTFEDGDWFHPPENVAKMAAGTPLTDRDRWPWLHAIADWIDATVRDGRHGITACSALKREYRAALVGAHQSRVRIVYLDGDRQLIGERMRKRKGHFMPETLLDSQFATLEEPTEEERPINVSVKGTPDQVAARVVQAIETEIGAPLPPGP